MKRTCSNCKWWNPARTDQREDVDEIGACNRHSPRQFYTAKEIDETRPSWFTPTGQWPTTQGKARCGDWECKPDMLPGTYRRIEDCRFTKPVKDLLVNYRIFTLRDLCLVPKIELLNISGVGTVACHVVGRELESSGIDWSASVQSGSVVLINDQAKGE